MNRKCSFALCIPTKSGKNTNDEQEFFEKFNSQAYWQLVSLSYLNQELTKE